jgi:hypothetical protein
MKRNLIRLIIAVLLASAWIFYLHWSNDRIQNGRKAQKITCVNNLKQIGLAFRIWSGDNHDQYPFNVSTNAGGTMGFCAFDKDGFDCNSFLHFKVMAGEDYLRIPLLLICPQDHSKKAATNWASLGPENVTYRLRSGTNVCEANPHEILAVCPVDGNILYCDGTVLGKNDKLPGKNDKLPMELKPFLPFEVMTNSPSNPKNLSKTNEHLLQLK